ncbi:MAG: carboxymuconolactone decarboxylase family protein [Pseudomonadaceae bacterium]|nr:carboxymuconolactone decarboxylase family protein [Pseudomonadaceae bacterium]
MTRLKKKPYEQLTPAQQATFDEIVANRPVKPADGHIGGPFDIWLRSPEMGKRLVGLGGFFRFRSSVDRRYIELAILVTGAHWRAQFEWFAHEPMAREAGVPDPVIAAIKTGETPAFEDGGDAAAYNLARQLHENRKLSDAAFTEAVTQFGETGVAELIGLCGFYSLVSMTLNGFDVELPDGATYPFDRD